MTKDRLAALVAVCKFYFLFYVFCCCYIWKIHSTKSNENTTNSDFDKHFPSSCCCGSPFNHLLFTILYQGTGYFQSPNLVIVLEEFKHFRNFERENSDFPESLNQHISVSEFPVVLELVRKQFHEWCRDEIARASFHWIKWSSNSFPKFVAMNSLRL